MDTTLQHLLTLAREGNVERRCAALLVLGALKLQDPSIVETVGAALGHANVVLKDYALRYFEEARPKASIPLLLPLLDDADKDLCERVIRLLVGFGQAVVRPLLQRAKTAPHSWQLNAARVLCAVRGKAAWKGVLQLLPQGASELNKAVCDAVAAALREMGRRSRKRSTAKSSSLPQPWMSKASAPLWFRLFGSWVSSAGPKPVSGSSALSALTTTTVSASMRSLLCSTAYAAKSCVRTSVPGYYPC